MTPRSLFLIVLKCLGIFFIKEVLTLIPQLSYIFLFITNRESMSYGIWVFFLTLFMLGIYLLVIYYLVFKTGVIVDKLKLTEHFDQENFSLKIHRSSVLSIVITITGILILVDGIPLVCRQVLNFFGEKQLAYVSTQAGIRNIIIPVVQVLIGLLMIIKQKTIVNFIERKRRIAHIENDTV